MTAHPRTTLPVRHRLVWHAIHIIAGMAAVYPLILLLDVYGLRTQQPAGWLLILLSMAGLGTLLRTAGQARASGWKWIISLVIYMMLTAAALVWLYSESGGMPLLITAVVLGAAAMLYGIVLAEGQWDRVFPLKWQMILLGVTWIAYVAAGHAGGLDEVRGSIYAAGAISIFSILFRLGSQQIGSIAFEEGFSLAALRAVIRRSRSWTWLVVILIAIIGGSSQLSAALRWLWHRLVQLLSSDVKPQLSQPTEPVNPPMLPPMDLPESDSSSLNPLILERIAQIVMLLALAAFAGWLGWMLYRLIRKYAPRLSRWLASLWGGVLAEDAAEPKGYTDHTEKIQKPLSPRRRWNRRSEPIPSDPSGRVRYHYRQLLNNARKKGITVNVADTPTDIARRLSPSVESSVSDQHRLQGIQTEQIRTSNIQTQQIRLSSVQRLIDWYNDVRYGNHSVSEEELQQWEQQQKHPK
ncbi:DUF4129 domain-containing protein [Paenibacillus sp. Z6-24]